MGGRGFNRVDEEEEASSVNQFQNGEAEHLDELLPNGHRTYGILIQMDERDVLALKKEAGHPEGRRTNFQKGLQRQQRSENTSS
jgi:hypothetical protein